MNSPLGLSIHATIGKDLPPVTSALPKVHQLILLRLKTTPSKIHVVIK